MAFGDIGGTNPALILTCKVAENDEPIERDDALFLIGDGFQVSKNKNTGDTYNRLIFGVAKNSSKEYKSVNGFIAIQVAVKGLLKFKWDNYFSSTRIVYGVSGIIMSDKTSGKVISTNSDLNKVGIITKIDNIEKMVYVLI